MPEYVFTFKKGDITLELLASDHRFISHQMDLWLGDVAGFTPETVLIQEFLEKKTVSPVKEEVREKVVEAPVKKSEIKVEKPEAPKVVKQAEVLVDKPVVLEKPVVEEVIQEKPVKVSKKVEKAVVKEEAKPEVIEIEEEPEEEKVNVVKQTIKNVAKKAKLVQEVEKVAVEEIPEKAVIKQVIQNEPDDEPLEIEYKHVTIEEDEVEELEDEEEIEEEKFTFEEIDDIDDLEAAHSIAQKSAEADKNEFYQILQDKFSALPDMVTEKVDEKLSKVEVKPPVSKSTLEFSGIEDIIKFKKPQTLLDYLVITSYYLKMHDMLDKYSLKQINSKVLVHTKKLIDHGVIQEAVAQNLMEVVPDYTGMADVTEYVITQEGISYLLHIM